MTEAGWKLLVASTKEHEGYRETAYQDTLGHWTIGYGTNLEVLTIDEETAERWLDGALLRARKGIERQLGFAEADDVRQAVLVEMAYQLGVAGCLAFRRMWAEVGRGDWWAAASEMLASRWAEQTPKRAEELAGRMRHGTWSGRASPAVL